MSRKIACPLCQSVATGTNQGPLNTSVVISCKGSCQIYTIDTDHWFQGDEDIGKLDQLTDAGKRILTDHIGKSPERRIASMVLESALMC